jgi:hypothetical protein
MGLGAQRANRAETHRNTATTWRWDGACDRFGHHRQEDMTPMTFAKLFGTATLAFAALSLAAAAPASARERDMHHRHEHKVCKWERHHGHKQRVCRWVRS